MIEVYTGRPGSGKSQKLAKTLIEIIERNQRFYEKTGKIREIYTNFHLRPDLEEKYSGALRHWKDLEQLTPTRDCDVFIDEIFNYFDAKHWGELSFSVRRWLSQHRKMGVEIYGNCQDFSQVDISFRRMVSDLFYLVKLAGSRDPSPTRPPIKWIWGICVVYTMQPTDYKEDQKENKTQFNGVMFIDRASIELYDTREIIKPGVFPPLQHSERFCQEPNCSYKKVVHN